MCHIHPAGRRISPSRVLAALLTVVCFALSARPTQALQPNPLHIGLTPALGWSSWSSFRGNASTAKDEAVARAMVSSGLARLGYRYINQDDGWYAVPARIRAHRQQRTPVTAHRR